MGVIERVVARVVWDGGRGGGRTKISNPRRFVRAPDKEVLIHAGNDPHPVPVSTASTAATTYALHAESLPTPGLPVGEDGCVKACLLASVKGPTMESIQQPRPVKCW